MNEDIRHVYLNGSGLAQPANDTASNSYIQWLQNQATAVQGITIMRGNTRMVLPREKRFTGGQSLRSRKFN